MGLEGFDRVFLGDVGLNEALVVVKVDKVGCLIVLASLATFWAVPSKVSYFSALETGI